MKYLKWRNKTFITYSVENIPMIRKLKYFQKSKKGFDGSQSRDVGNSSRSRSQPKQIRLHRKLCNLRNNINLLLEK